MRMVTENLTKTQFIVDILNRDVSNIYQAMRLIAEKSTRLEGRAMKEKKRKDKIGVRTGTLLKSVQNPDFTIAGINGSFQVNAYIPLHMRFLDMKEKGNWMIYNRQVWGILYNNSLRDLKYGYGEEIRDLVGTALAQAFSSSFSSTSSPSSSSTGQTKHEIAMQALEGLIQKEKEGAFNKR